MPVSVKRREPPDSVPVGDRIPYEHSLVGGVNITVGHRYAVLIRRFAPGRVLRYHPGKWRIDGQFAVPFAGRGVVLFDNPSTSS